MARRGNYPIGTEVQDKTGRVKKRLSDAEMKDFNTKNKWISRGRYAWMKEHGEELNENQRVFHIDGDKKNDDPSNLVPITFSGTRYELAHSRVLWVPRQATTGVRKLEKVA